MIAILIILLCASWLAYMFITAPEGYEDETGFHRSCRSGDVAGGTRFAKQIGRDGHRSLKP